MNLALPALVVFVLLLPGFIARARIKRAERQSLDYSPFGQLVAEAVTWAAGLHLAWLALAAVLIGRWPDIGVALQLLAVGPAQASALATIGTHGRAVAAYLLSLLAFAWVGPWLIRALVVRLRLDRAGSPLAPLLRFNRAPWYYLLSGADFERDRAPDLIAISAIVNVSDRPWLYTGILDDYYLDPEGRLDRLVLEKVMRRPLERDKRADRGGGQVERFYPIDGDYFVLRYDETITLNVEYIKFESEN